MRMKTKEDYIAKHKELWNWLSENPDKTKEDWPGWKINEHMDNNCFLCGYVDMVVGGGCFDCPISWGRTEMCTDDYPKLSYYLLYEGALKLKDKATYAKIIANLPEKTER